MAVVAKLKYQRLSPQKARLVADIVRGKNALQALNILKFTNKKATLTKLFIEKLTEEFEKLKNTVEYKTYLFGLNLAELGFNNENIIKDKDIKKVFYRNNESIIINPYKGEIEINIINDQEKIKKIFEEIY